MSDTPTPDLSAPRHMRDQDLHTTAYEWAKNKAEEYERVGLGWNFKEASARDGYVAGARAKAKEAAAREAQVAETLKGLLSTHADALDIEPAEQLSLTPAEWKRFNIIVRAAATSLGIDLT